MGKKKPAVETRALDTGSFTEVRLDSLHVSPHNVRKVDINDLSGLRASIVEQGLLQPLVGYEKEQLFYIAAGQRRLLAMQGLMRDKVLTPETVIPVRLVDETTAIEISLAENIERKQMNPADEVRAFKALVDTGAHNAETIAKRFGYDVRFVRRRLRMAVLAEVILEQLEKGELTVNQAEAFAASDDPDHQVKCWTKLKKQGSYGLTVSSILSEVSGRGISPTGPLAIFIGGEQAYLEAGGTIDEEDAFDDLFRDETYGHDKRPRRLVDNDVIRDLTRKACEANYSKALKLAKKIYDFVSMIEWAKDLTKLNPGKPPAGLVKIGEEYSYNQKPEVTQDIARKVAEAGGTVAAIAGIDDKGKLAVSTKFFFVGKDALAQVTPKSKKDRPAPAWDSEEAKAERAAAERKRSINNLAAALFARTLVGPTPGFGIRNVDVDRTGRITMTLFSDEPIAEELTVVDEWKNRSLAAEAVKPFMDEATKRIDAMIEAEAIAQAEAAAKAKALAEASEALFAELETTAIVDWPAKAVIEFDHGEIEIQHVIEEGNHVLLVQTPDGDEWTSDNVLETMGTLKDCLVDSDWTIAREEGEIVTITSEDPGEPQPNETDENSSSQQFGDGLEIPSNDECQEEREPATN